jgi:hypothetical protein
MMTECSATYERAKVPFWASETLRLRLAASQAGRCMEGPVGMMSSAEDRFDRLTDVDGGRIGAAPAAPPVSFLDPQPP